MIRRSLKWTVKPHSSGGASGSPFFSRSLKPHLLSQLDTWRRPIKAKTLTTAAIMGIGLALAILELKVQQPDGVVLMIAGVLFGAGLHWYRRGLAFKTLLVAILMAMVFPVTAGAVVMGEALLGLEAAILAGVSWRMVR